MGFVSYEPSCICLGWFPETAAFLGPLQIGFEIQEEDKWRHQKYEFRG